MRPIKDNEGVPREVRGDVITSEDCHSLSPLCLQRKARPTYLSQQLHNSGSQDLLSPHLTMTAPISNLILWLLFTFSPECMLSLSSDFPSKFIIPY